MKIVAIFLVFLLISILMYDPPKARIYIFKNLGRDGATRGLVRIDKTIIDIPPDESILEITHAGKNDNNLISVLHTDDAGHGSYYGCNFSNTPLDVLQQGGLIDIRNCTHSYIRGIAGLPLGVSMLRQSSEKSSH